MSVGEELKRQRQALFYHCNVNISRSLPPKNAALVPLDESCHMTTLKWKVVKGKGA